MRNVLSIFGVLNDTDVEWIARTGFLRRLNYGDIIIREGENTDFLIFLLEGGLVVTTTALGEIARMNVGDIVGEISLVDSAPPSATITARGNGLALFLEKKQLVRKLEKDDGFAARFYRALAMFLADRLRDARASTSAVSATSENAIETDELDIGILDHLSIAGDRFNRMLRTLSRGSLDVG
jgi:CRP/FNR family cyclic AMP-dependent transcriptional regulator